AYLHQALDGAGGGGDAHRQMAELGDDVVNGLGAGDGGGEVGDEDLAVDQLGDELGGFLGGDLAVGIEGHQGLDELGGAGSALGAAQGLFQVVRGVDRHQMVGAHLVLQARLGVAQPAGGAVEAGVGPV